MVTKTGDKRASLHWLVIALKLVNAPPNRHKKLYWGTKINPELKMVLFFWALADAMFIEYCVHVDVQVKLSRFIQSL